MNDVYADWEETRVKTRPSRKGSRPRTKKRPNYDDAILGRVITVNRGRYRVVISEPIPRRRVITATRSSHLHNTAVVVGDFVKLVGDTSGGENSLARLVAIQKRTTLLRRSADDTDECERIIVANATQMLIIGAAAQPAVSLGFIDRALVTAHASGITPILLITKTDLAPPGAITAAFGNTGLPILMTSRAAVESPFPLNGLAKVNAALNAATTVLIGPSGVGKSTLINALTNAERATAPVNRVTGRGRHTSSSAVAFPLHNLTDQASGSWIIDTPGIRSFGLGFIDNATILAAFTDLNQAATRCPKNCSHIGGAPGCYLDEYASQTPSSRRRLQSLRKLLHKTQI